MAEWKPCGKCGTQMHRLQNCRVVLGKVVCIPCYMAMFPPRALVPHVQPLSFWQRFWRWFA